MLHSPRLSLHPLTHELKLVFQESPARFASTLGVTLPQGWPEFPEAFAPRENETDTIWGGYLFVLRETSQLVGNGGYYGPPDEAGNVEIGYETAPEFRGKGFATEAAQALLDHAFQNGARSVCATTLAETNASNAVARKLGMEFVEEILDEEAGAVWKFKLRR